MGERLNILLTGMAHGGQALGRHAGRVVFVPYAAPDEEATVEIVEEGRGWARGRLLEVLRPSPLRADPLCPYYGRCGGCQLQHLTYAAQLAIKRDVTRDQLARLGRLTGADVRAVVGMDDPWRYRNQAHLYPAADAGLGIKAGANLQPFPVDDCPLFHPVIAGPFHALDLELAGLRRLTLRGGARTGDAMVLLETEGDEPPELEVNLPISVVLSRHGGAVQVLAGSEHIVEELAGRRLRVSALSPFPPNSAMAEQIIAAAGQWLEPRPGDLLLDANGGVGAYGLALAGDGVSLLAVAETFWTVEDFVANAGERPQTGIIEAGLAEGLAEIDADVDIALVHAPREGLGPAAAELGRLGPRRLAYLAEDPAVLARDAAGLQRAGYRLAAVQPFDMLPQTYHVQVMGFWERR
jgi:23S rRNA (uracil1939-C5)-methyltransferase